MEMTVIVEEFYYTHSLLEAGALLYHAVGAEGGGEEGKCGQESLLWFHWKERERQGKQVWD